MAALVETIMGVVREVLGDSFDDEVYEPIVSYIANILADQDLPDGHGIFDALGDLLIDARCVYDRDHCLEVCTKLCDKLGSHGIVKPKPAARSLATPLRMNVGMEEQVAQNKPEHYDLRESMAPGDRKDALPPPPSRLALPASIEYLRDAIEGALGQPVPDCSKLLPCLQEHIFDLQEELIAHLHEEKEARDQHVAKLEEDLHAAALRIHHLEKESAMNAQEKEVREQLAAHAAKLEEDLHAATLRIHHLEMEFTMNARRCMEEKEAREQLAAHAAKLEEDLHAAKLRMDHLEVSPLLSSRSKAKLERNKRKEDRQREAQYQMLVAEIEALRAGMPSGYVNHSNVGGTTIRDIHMENFSVIVGGLEAHTANDRPSMNLEDGSAPMPNHVGGPSQRAYILSQGATLTTEMKEKIEEKVKSIQSEVPIYVKELTKTCIVGSSSSKSRRSLKFCGEFTKKWLPARKAKISLRLEDETHLWPTIFNREGTKGYFYKGWKEFVRYNKLKEGDVCLFQTKKRFGQTLTVYLIRRPETDL